LEVFVVLLIPRQFKQRRDELELEKEVNAGLIASINQFDYVRLDTVF
jgi:hypothetical protein